MEGVEQPLLVASDVDGTLLTADELMTGRTAATVRRVQASRTPFVLVSGRPPRWIPPVARQADVTGYAVCANGAAVYDIGADTVVATDALAPDVLEGVLDAVAQALPNAHVAAERVAGSGSTAPHVSEHGFHNPWGEGDVQHVSRARVVARPATKLLVSDRTMTSDVMAHALRAVMDGSVDVTYSTMQGLIEVSARGVTKATGLATVCELLGVRPSDVVAFGDMPNDIAMLEWAGHGVAMSNAHPDVLAVADEVTGANHDDGVAAVLERWF